MRFTRTVLALPAALALALALAACGGDDDGAATCPAIDAPLNGSCVATEGSCIEYYGEADVDSLALGCALGDGTWSTGVCPDENRGAGGCRIKSDTVLTPADPEVGAYYVSFHPDARALCAAAHGCWVN